MKVFKIVSDARVTKLVFLINKVEQWNLDKREKIMMKATKDDNEGHKVLNDTWQLRPNK